MLKLISKWYYRELEKELEQKFEREGVSLVYFKKCFAKNPHSTWKGFLKWQHGVSLEEIINYRLTMYLLPNSGAYWVKVTNRLAKKRLKGNFL